MPAAPIIAAGVALVGQAVLQNQQVQHARGAAQAQQTAADAAAKAQGAIGPAAVPTAPTISSDVVNAQDAQRRKNALRAGLVSTLGPNPLGSTGSSTSAPVAYGSGGKTALGQ